MALPAKPVRKAASTGNDNLARATSKNVPGASAYNRKAATNGSSNSSAYIRKPSGVTPGGLSVNDKDAGKGTGNVRSAGRSKPNMKGVD